MSHTYEISAHAATVNDHGYSIRYSLIGDLEGARRIVEVNKPADLVAAKHELGLAVLATNEFEVQHPTVTSPPRPLVAVHISHRPLKRHGPGFKSLDYGLLVKREDAV